MAGSERLDSAQTILLAVHLAIESDLAQLQILSSQQRHTLTPNLLYSILLTYLPTDAENTSNLASFLRILQDEYKNFSDLDTALDQSLVQEYSVIDARKTLHKLRLTRNGVTLKYNQDDELSTFIVQWLQEVEAVSGLPASAVHLLDHFVANRPKLLLWRDSYLIPLIKLQNDFYPGRADNLSTEILQDLQGEVGVRSLLQFVEQDSDGAHVGRDLSQVVAPWIQGASRAKRRRIDGEEASEDITSWQDVNEWMFMTSRKNFHLASRAFLDWSILQGNTDNSEGNPLKISAEEVVSYVQTGLATVVSSSDTGKENNTLLRRLLDRATSILSSIQHPSDHLPRCSLSDASRADLLENNLLRISNPVTTPAEETFNFLQHCLQAQELLEGFKLSVPIIAIIDAALFGPEEKQKRELQSLLQQVPRLTKAEIDWPLIRQHLYTLHDGRTNFGTQVHSKSAAFHYLGRLSDSYIESECLSALLLAGQYSVISDIYIDSPDCPLGKDIVRNHVVDAVYNSYDNASNGNRTRGGMKRASEILKALRVKFASDPVFDHIEHLLRATHALSFYHLTLQHGIPFQPANIRIHQDPVSLLEQVLTQNSKSYTKLDDLLEIGRNLVKADSPNSTDPSWPTKSIEERLLDTEHRITYLAINSALSDHDFNTAYSYIVTRLATNPSQIASSPFPDDTSWRAAYAAGKYRPLSLPKSLHDRITELSKRMDLLSLALTLTPTPEPLSEILATWRRCEEELDSLKVQAVQEERAVDGLHHNNSTLPGGFDDDKALDAAETRRLMERRAMGGVGPSYEEEAPMGLFDVARGAASAFRKSAFPLRGANERVNIRDHPKFEDDSGGSGTDEARAISEQQRVRKRDVVSNMVTGGLVSGMSWVLGAPPSAGQTDER